MSLPLINPRDTAMRQARREILEIVAAKVKEHGLTHIEEVALLTDLAHDAARWLVRGERKP